MGEVVTPQRRLLPSSAGEFVSKGGKWVPALTPKMQFMVETVDEETGEQRMVGHPLLDANGQPVMEPNPAAVRMIKNNHADLGYVPVAPMAEPKAEQTKISQLEATVARLEALVTGAPVLLRPSAPAEEPIVLDRDGIALAAKAPASPPAPTVEVSAGQPGSASRTRTVRAGRA